MKPDCQIVVVTVQIGKICCSVYVNYQSTKNDLRVSAHFVSSSSKRTHRDIISSCIINTRNSYAYTHTVYTKICRHININNLKLVCRK